MKVLGVHCTAKHVFLALASDGEVQDGFVERLAPSQSVDEERALRETFDTIRTAIVEIAPDQIHLLRPGGGEMARRGHEEWRPRIELETLLRFAASDVGIPLDRLSRPTVLKRLGCDPKAKFEPTMLATLTEVGRYWSAGRMHAAAAALAIAG